MKYGCRVVGLIHPELTKLLADSQPSISEKEQAIRESETAIQSKITSLDRDRYNGLAARMEALGRLTAGSMSILYASIFIMLLFVAIETAPILVKLISYRSPYDYLLHELEHVYEMANLEKTTLLSNSVKNKLKFDTETGAHLVQSSIAVEKALIDHKLKEKLESLKSRPYDWTVGGAV